MPEMEFGRCDICGQEASLSRQYYRYKIKCECHSPQHFEICWHCSACEPQEPKSTKVYLRTADLEKET